MVVVHDEIDLPFGEIKVKLGGGAAGHNGLKSLAAGLWERRLLARPRRGGRPDSTDPEIVSAYVLGRFAEPDEEVSDLIARRRRASAERLVDQIVASINEVLRERSEANARR